MTPRQVTTAFILAAVAVIFGFDLAMWCCFGPKATISMVVRNWTRTCPAVPGLVAAAMVYLWWHWFGK